MEIHDNPLSAEAQAAPPSNTSELRSGEEMAREYELGTLRKGTVGWLSRVSDAETKRITRERLHYKFSSESGREEDLGEIKYSWVFVFTMGLKDDGDKNVKFPQKQQWGDEDRIPLEVWQLVHRLRMNRFDVKHTFSLVGEHIYVFVGLPYKTLVETASKMRITMRLKSTKGTHGFLPELAEVYATGDNYNGSTFSSAHRQGLTLYRLKFVAHIDPDLSFVHKNLNKESALRKMKKRQAKNVAHRGMQVAQLMNMYGAYRPSADKLFGKTVARVADAVMKDPWMMIHSPAEGDLSPIKQQIIQAQAISYGDMQQTLNAFSNWSDGPGQHESFDGAFVTFFALHDKDQLVRFKKIWGNFAMAWNTKGIMGKDPEYMSMHSMCHPANEEKKQFAPLWQPLDEIRDYFGEHVGLYFCWLELYTRALFWPAGLGFFVIFNQLTHDAGPDGNIFTVPYTMFFAAWSITFLSSWKRRQNELKFLWGTENFEIHERPRAQFRGAHVVNAETGRDDIVYEKPVKRAIILALSGSISFMLIMVTLYWAVKATGIKDQNRLSPAEELDASLYDKHKWAAVASMLNLLIIAVAGQLYELLAFRLTEWENHRTNTEFEDSIIFKNFLFQSLNNYFVLFYIAVIRPFYAPCQVLVTDGSTGGSSNGEYYDVSRCRESDLPELQFQLIIVFTGKTIGWRAAELALPKLKRHAKELMRVLQIRGALEIASNAFEAVTDEFDHQLDNIDSVVTQSAHGMFDSNDRQELEYSALQIQKAVRGHMSRKATEMGKATSNYAGQKSPKSKSGQADVELAGRMKGGAELHGVIPLDKRVALSRAKGTRWARAVLHLSERVVGAGQAENLGAELNLPERLAGGTFDAETADSGGNSTAPDASASKDGEPERLEGGAFDAEKEDSHISQSKIHTLSKKEQKKEIKKHLREQYAKDDNVEDEFVMEPLFSTFTEFNEMVIQFGYLSLFAPAYPLAPLLALINNIFEIRIDAVKFCTEYQRPRYRQAEDIGSWYHVMSTIGFLSVITNATMLAFVGSQLGNEDEKGGPEAGRAGIDVRIYSQRLWTIAVIIEHAVLVGRIVISQLSPENPTWVTQARETLEFRANLLESKAAEYMRESNDINACLSQMNDSMVLARSALVDELVPNKNKNLKRIQKALPFASGAPPQAKPESKVVDIDFHDDELSNKYDQ